MLRRNCISQT